MTKKVFFLLLIINVLFLCSCKTVVNEIYNVTYEGTISLEEFEELTEAVIKKTEDSVIAINNYKKSFGSFTNSGSGSAVVYKTIIEYNNSEQEIANSENIKREDINKFCYYAITNEHVIRESDITRVIIDENGQEIDCEVISYNVIRDLAIIYFESEIYVPSVILGDSEELNKGSFVIAIGSPYGLDFFNTCSFGIVSHNKRILEEEHGSTTYPIEYIQHDASINPGNSGGALVNMRGELVGINTMKIEFDGESTEGMGFAIPVNVLKEFIKNYEK